MVEADGRGNVVSEYIYLNGRLLAGVKSGKQLIETILDIDPDTLNRYSQGNWMTAYITLAPGYDVSDIDPVFRFIE